MIDEIFRGLHNPEFIDKVMYHMQEDGGGLGQYSVALFGTPGTGAFEFVLTGRHCTVRCDGDSVAGRGVRRTHLLRPRFTKLRRSAGPSEERLLVSGQARQRGFSGARREAAGGGATGRSARGEGQRQPLR